MFFVYILASGLNGTLYVGSTPDIVRRIWQHKTKAVTGFTAKYGVDRLVWFEAHESMAAACAVVNAAAGPRDRRWSSRSAIIW